MSAEVLILQVLTLFQIDLKHCLVFQYMGKVVIQLDMPRSCMLSMSVCTHKLIQLESIRTISLVSGVLQESKARLISVCVIVRNGNQFLPVKAAAKQ